MRLLMTRIRLIPCKLLKKRTALNLLPFQIQIRKFQIQVRKFQLQIQVYKFQIRRPINQLQIQVRKLQRKARGIWTGRICTGDGYVLNWMAARVTTAVDVTCTSTGLGKLLQITYERMRFGQRHGCTGGVHKAVLKWAG